MIEWYKKVVFDNYANFSGRARRSEYWYYTLATIIISMLLGLVDFVSNLTIGLNPGMGITRAIYSLLVFLPGLAVMVRRLHDVGKSGWFFFIIFIPLAGVIWLLIVLCTEGDSGPNAYGPDPKNEFDEINEIGNVES
ncbi:DUF805 domain-containing protein [Flavobacterium hibernum]|uniref:DUF805 domain-containing protein n=1 Tax=Flavobacterium hibernum TaxID=37752 RepID=A0A0D0EY82_9FLAO|nr:DUF805 domain-containing protein [Flavobacterium hibernum]KIO50587.1 hypothetical protein IW18_21770 [Flavobacterium hibernum]OXA87452.1 DUF805 domain-containing protein [Flavobacterium hibernum]PTS99913.1 DUF805 domain-containing protein [Flavobacterium sp. HMWF030]STO14320.1 Inner membrane protein yhaH [Flavobacterium hibernum]